MTPGRTTRLGGTTVIVTGAGRGLGRITARALASAGARVGLVARTPAELHETAMLIRCAGGIAVCAAADVTDDAQTVAAVDAVQRALGPVDVLVNNAGVNGPIGAFAEVDAAAWWRTMEVNLGGAVRCTRLVLGGMQERGHGRVINVTSVAGTYRWPTVSAYAVSKAALVKFTENIAAEVRRHGVSVFSFHPGLLPVGLAEAGMRSTAGEDSPEGRIAAWARRQQAEGRFTEPERAARYICALASGRADRLSGRHLEVDDDLDQLLAAVDDVLREDVQTLRLRKLSA